MYVTTCMYMYKYLIDDWVVSLSLMGQEQIFYFPTFPPKKKKKKIK